MDSLINIGIYVTYLLLAVAILGTLGFALVQIFSNLKNAKNGLIGVGVLVAILLISYALSPAETGAFYTKHQITAGFSKVIGGGLLATFIIFVGVVVSIIYSEVAKWFK